MTVIDGRRVGQGEGLRLRPGNRTRCRGHCSFSSLPSRCWCWRRPAVTVNGALHGRDGGELRRRDRVMA